MGELDWKVGRSCFRRQTDFAVTGGGSVLTSVLRNRMVGCDKSKICWVEEQAGHSGEQMLQSDLKQGDSPEGHADFVYYSLENFLFFGTPQSLFLHLQMIG